jgi:hypothetical protein
MTLSPAEGSVSEASRVVVVGTKAAVALTVTETGLEVLVS